MEKYTAETQKKLAKKRKNALYYKRNPRSRGKYWRLIIPAIVGYGVFPVRPHPGLDALKTRILDMLYKYQLKRGLKWWCIAWQTHPGTGLPHLDILLLYEESILNPLKRYDYLVKHGDLTRYRSPNKAILDYGTKEDSAPIKNFNADRVLLKHRASNDLFVLMSQAMLKIPFKFNANIWLTENRLWATVAQTNIFKTLRLIRERQNAECARKGRLKPGIQLITRGLIEQRLSAVELAVYDSWPGYAVIVAHINQIPRWGYRRPHKTKNLLISGRSNTGKSALAHKIAEFTSVYPVGTAHGWFPHFNSDTYKMLIWDEFTMRVMTYPELLRLLEGAPMHLPVKGGHVPRADNQLIYMTSNWALHRIIMKKFRKCDEQLVADMNFRARVTCVQIPVNRNLFLLLKLILPCERCHTATPSKEQREYFHDVFA